MALKHTLFAEKYAYDWRYFCEKNNFVKDTHSGLLISKSLGELYMTFLAREVAYQNEALLNKSFLLTSAK